MLGATNICTGPPFIGASLLAQRVKRLPTMRETWVGCLGREDPLEKEMATHSSILAWKIPWMEDPGRLQSMGSQRVRRDWATSHTHTHTNLLSCLVFCISFLLTTSLKGDNKPYPSHLTPRETEARRAESELHWEYPETESNSKMKVMFYFIAQVVVYSYNSFPFSPTF